MSLDAPIIPAASRRNHWMAQIATQTVNKPAAVAFRYLGVDTTWGDPQDRVMWLAVALARRGVGFGDHVLMLTLNSPAVAESVFAINMLGAMAVPIDIRLTPPEIAYIVDDADADILIVDAPLAPLVGAVSQFTSRIKRVIVRGEAAGQGQEASEALVAEGIDGRPAVDPVHRLGRLRGRARSRGRALARRGRHQHGFEEGDLDAGIWTVGQVQGLIDDVPPAGDVVRRTVAQAEAVLRERLSLFAEPVAA